MLFTNDKCTIRIDKAISKKTNKEYTRCVITVNGRDYITFDNNLINNVLLDNLLKK